MVSNMSNQWTVHLTTHSSQSLNNDTSTIKLGQVFNPCNNPENLVDKATADILVQTVNITVIFLEVFGVTTNAINMIAFALQGLKDRINLCLFSLALADMIFLLLNFTAMFYSVLGLFDKDLEEYWGMKYIGTVLGPKLGCMNISNLLTMIISLERCICVVSPFRAKKFLKTRYMAVLIVMMAVYVLGMYSLLNLKYQTVHLTDPLTNTSSWVLRVTKFYLDNKTAIDILYNYLLVLAVPCLSLAVVTVTTLITITRLRQTTAWRQQSANTDSSGGAEGA